MDSLARIDFLEKNFVECEWGRCLSCWVFIIISILSCTP